MRWSKCRRNILVLVFKNIFSQFFNSISFYLTCDFFFLSLILKTVTFIVSSQNQLMTLNTSIYRLWFLFLVKCHHVLIRSKMNGFKCENATPFQLAHPPVNPFEFWKQKKMCPVHSIKPLIVSIVWNANRSLITP